ncbi:MAG TPA: YeeE/YedE thiosulfate transporter family protein [Ferruginibacter sp.]|nr:YeeE/YedE thiosulfate transporter family protein [Ferruginibacter sp.]
MLLHIFSAPWPWYVSGPVIGLMVPLLLLIGNKSFGISSSLRHVCAACIPAKIPFFNYNWKKETWNLFFVAGIFLGGIVAATVMLNPQPVQVDPRLVASLQTNGIYNFQNIVPTDLFNWSSLLTLRGFMLMVVGGFLVGFGTRYAGGCTSGHAIMGLSNLQFPSLVATMSFMAGGFIMANFILPYILKLTI